MVLGGEKLLEPAPDLFNSSLVFVLLFKYVTEISACTLV